MWLLLYSLTFFANFAECFNFDTPIVLQGNLSVNLERQCPDGWKTFQRQKGLYCIQVFSDPPNPYTQTIAQSMCNDIGSRLAGIETITERNYILRTAYNLMVAAGGSQARLWVGAVRSYACITNSTLPTKCNDPLYAFYWEDSHVVGNDQLIFTTGQPNNNGTGQQCVQMCVATFPTTDDAIPTYGRTSLLDDVSCDVGQETAAIYQDAMYVCGMAAPIVSFST